jgi:hypothetical protein
MSVPSTRALRRTPLVSAMLAVTICFGGVTAARLATDQAPRSRLQFMKAVDTAQANAPSPRALGLTAAYFKTLGIGTREAPPEAPPVRPTAKECESHASSRLARRAVPAPTTAPADSSHLTTARVPRALTSPTGSRVSLTIALHSE